ncbi:nitrate- and nitrite sensing domain-containing protein [Streptomyces sp. PSKA30]|uniref:sensor histidine kinase n=1 Tax=Streptomyces sp. PSKA30 TaxID=2874597 RepID=UPI001CD12A0E|nr:nitrate- and nitrite sensing domain-containing protein [Streptomyces sp. PSKA30]MBZ9645426.1 nitrate- and nitrite sensing domain-containing protein [Streptomyces sp. PSKA30]
MNLNRLLIRQRLNLLVLLPLCLVLLLTVPFVSDRLQNLRDADRSAEQVDAARHVGELVHELANERALAVGYLLTPESPSAPLAERAAAVEDRITALKRFFEGEPPAELDEAVAGLGGFDLFRNQIRLRLTTPDRVNSVFDQAIRALLDALEVTVGRTSDEAADRGYATIQALLRANEASSRAAALTMRLVLDPRPVADGSGDIALEIRTAVEVQKREANEFRRHAEPKQAELFRRVDTGEAARHVAALRAEVEVDLADSGRRASDDLPASHVYGEIETDAAVRHLLEDRIGEEIEHHARAEAAQARLAALVFAVLAVVLFLGTVFLSVAIGRSIAGPLRRLTGAATQVADLAGQELVRVADDEMEEQAPPQLAAIVMDSRDEIGELAQAVNHVQGAAALLLERQVSSRRNIATMFGNLGRRTQKLVSRQLAIIDVLEGEERDSDRLERLYKLDHLTARLRRHADSLLVLSGWTEQSVMSAPISVADAVRIALGGIEEFRRVRLRDIDEALLRPEVTGDILLVIAELLENATAFSPPGSQVEVSARLFDGACHIRIVDHGVGMSAERMAEANIRIKSRERLDLAPTDVLGLFVVGRLSRRHSLETHLSPTPHGGVTVDLRLPGAVLVDRAGKPSRTVAGQAPADPRAEAAHAARVPSGAVVPSREPRMGHPVAPSLPAGSQPAGPGQPGAPLTVVGGSGAGGDSPGGLVRRKPGAQLPDTDLPAEAPGPPLPDTVPGPPEVEDLLAHFDAGARRALSDHLQGGDDQQQGSRWVDTGADRGTAAAQHGELAWSGDGLERVAEAVSRQSKGAGQARPSFTWFDAGGRERGVPEAHPSAQAAGLPRRVPGAQLAAPVPSDMAVQSAQPLDPEEIRAAIEDFEAGVARARHAYPDVDTVRPVEP